MMGERDELWVRVLTPGGPDNDGPAKWYSLPELAAALRPLLAQRPQPAAPADDAALRAELRAADMADTIKAQAATIAKLTAERDELRTQLANLAGAVQSLLKDKEQLIAQLNDANERLKPFVTW
jgi:hypothetical protein